MGCALDVQFGTVCGMGTAFDWFGLAKSDALSPWAEAALEIAAKQAVIHSFNPSTTMLEVGAGPWLSGDHLHGKDLRRYQNGVPKPAGREGVRVVNALRVHIWSKPQHSPVTGMSCGMCTEGSDKSDRWAPTLISSMSKETPAVTTRRSDQYVGYFKGWGSSAALGVPCGVVQVSDYSWGGTVRTAVSDLPWFYRQHIDDTLPCAKHGNQKTQVADEQPAVRLPVRVWLPSPNDFLREKRMRKLPVADLVAAFETYDVLRRVDGMDPYQALDICTRL